MHRDDARLLRQLVQCITDEVRAILRGPIEQEVESVDVDMLHVIRSAAWHSVCRRND